MNEHLAVLRRLLQFIDTYENIVINIRFYGQMGIVTWENLYKLSELYKVYAEFSLSIGYSKKTRVRIYNDKYYSVPTTNIPSF